MKFAYRESVDLSEGRDRNLNTGFEITWLSRKWAVTKKKHENIAHGILCTSGLNKINSFNQELYKSFHYLKKKTKVGENTTKKLC